MSEWPATAIEKRKVVELVPYARNARTHSDEHVAQIAGAIREWGWTNPVLIDEDAGIIAGHGRVLAAQRLGLDEVPCVVARGWTKAQKQAYVLADNKLALNAGWDEELLAVEMKDLRDMAFDLSLVGFTEEEQLKYLSEYTEGLTDPDAAPALADDVVSKIGDLWILGRHRLLCGDSTIATDVEKLLNGVKPHLMVTDPPYGVEYNADWRNRSLGESDGGRAIGVVNNDCIVDWSASWSLFPGEVIYCWHDSMYGGQIQNSLEQIGFELRSQIIWAKSRFVISRGHYHWQHEACWYAVKRGKNGHWGGDRSQTTLWNIAHLKSETGHSTQKPIECMRRPIENNSSPGQTVYDPFVGSGTTIIAAEQTGRCCYAIEIDPRYVDVVVKRWQDFTGKEATLDGDGRTFNEIAAQ